ncbi:MAG: 50S ribosomal protein L11 methyltransferase [Fluviicoccus sp.]|uniref:class I SAM-dependent methyltransferase n=1 Tax=Fluviicoccus sp. TaxID=2003552 RepID=UPI0027276232|nr:50S ribosomal protein L11 methyltransferase [Fluviicoccus sp.]MDO8329560.1 50S ribosomal protein L11 methyltransferase [Fluviicoccus sp.]
MNFPAELELRLRQTLPSARLQAQTAPGLPEVRLWLLSPDFPRTPMSSDEMQAIWREPAYWIFCWASGLAMARRLLDHPETVRGKRVLDFGAGSGVVALAAVLAGASEVIACDIDPLALAACRANAGLNGVRLTYLEDFFALDERVDVLLAADVLYDRSNRFFLDEFLSRADRVLVADSRVRDFDHPAFNSEAEAAATTWPDLDEFDEFRTVRFYASR